MFKTIIPSIQKGSLQNYINYVKLLYYYYVKYMCVFKIKKTTTRLPGLQDKNEEKPLIRILVGPWYCLWSEQKKNIKVERRTDIIVS